jgi:hypothetical protein
MTEATVFGLAAFVAVLGVDHVFVNDPVRFTQLVTEDSWFEYGAAVALGTAALLLLLPTLSAGPGGRRVILALLCGIALFVAGEEVSWGQRVLGVETPESYAAMNLQGELTVHNLAALDFLNSRLNRVIGWVVLCWTVCSVSLRVTRPRRFTAMRAAGAPLIPIGLVPVFLLAPYFLLTRPVAKSDEVAEFFGSLAVALWAAGLAVQYGPEAARRLASKAGAMAGTLVFIAVSTGALTVLRPPQLLTSRLNDMASVRYPAHGMYEQALSLYEYMYQHPQHLTRDTRIEHGRLLLAMGETSAARRVLEEAIAEVEVGSPGPEDGERLRVVRELLEQTR